MVSKIFVSNAVADTLERFPDFPPRDDMQNYLHLNRVSIPEAIEIYLGDSETTLVGEEVPVSMDVTHSQVGVRVPDLLVAFDVDVPGIIERKGYAIRVVGKPPDFALEIASPSTGRNDYTDKRLDYERFGIREYWRFDPTGGEWHDVPLAGDRLVDGRYRPIEIEWSSKDMGRGYSAMLRLYVCWEEGHLRFYDPEWGGYLPTLHEETELRANERQRADRNARLAAQERERADRNAQLAAQEGLRAAQERQRADLAEEENRRLMRRLRELGETTDLL